jgi:hypothetical protein
MIDLCYLSALLHVPVHCPVIVYRTDRLLLLLLLLLLRGAHKSVSLHCYYVHFVAAATTTTVTTTAAWCTLLCHCVDIMSLSNYFSHALCCTTML